jgi:hypothetical protein
MKRPRGGTHPTIYISDGREDAARLPAQPCAPTETCGASFGGRSTMPSLATTSRRTVTATAP